MFLLFCTAGDLSQSPVHRQVHTPTELKSPATLGPSIILDNSKYQTRGQKTIYSFFFFNGLLFLFFFWNGAWSVDQDSPELQGSMYFPISAFWEVESSMFKSHHTQL